MTEFTYTHIQHRYTLIRQGFPGVSFEEEENPIRCGIILRFLTTFSRFFPGDTSSSLLRSKGYLLMTTAIWPKRPRPPTNTHLIDLRHHLVT